MEPVQHYAKTTDELDRYLVDKFMHEEFNKAHPILDRPLRQVVYNLPAGVTPPARSPRRQVRQTTTPVQYRSAEDSTRSFMKQSGAAGTATDSNLNYSLLFRDETPEQYQSSDEPDVQNLFLRDTSTPADYLSAQYWLQRINNILARFNIPRAQSKDQNLFLRDTSIPADYLTWQYWLQRINNILERFDRLRAQSKVSPGISSSDNDKNYGLLLRDDATERNQNSSLVYSRLPGRPLVASYVPQHRHVRQISMPAQYGYAKDVTSTSPSRTQSGGAGSADSVLNFSLLLRDEGYQSSEPSDVWPDGPTNYPSYIQRLKNFNELLRRKLEQPKASLVTATTDNTRNSVLPLLDDNQDPERPDVLSTFLESISPLPGRSTNSPNLSPIQRDALEFQNAIAFLERFIPQHRTSPDIAATDNIKNFVLPLLDDTLIDNQHPERSDVLNSSSRYTRSLVDSPALMQRYLQLKNSYA